MEGVHLTPSKEKERRPRGGSPPAGPRLPALGWPAALALVVTAVLAVAALSYQVMRSASASWARLLENEVADLVEAERLYAASELGARLTRDAILTSDPRTYRALGANQAQVLDLLARARSRAQSAEERAIVASLEEDHALIRDLGEALMSARLDGVPVELLALRLEAEVRPLRVRIDDTLARYARLHEEKLARSREAIATSQARAQVALGVAAGAGVLLAILLGRSLGRSLTALRRSEARFRATFDQAAVGIAHVGLDGRWLRLNRRYRELLGYDADELEGLRFQDLLHPEDRGADAVRLERLLAGEADGYALEARCLPRDGRSRWVNITCALVRDEDGRPRYFVRAAEDIAARKRVEKELRDAVRTRDEFLEIASHELRTPLSSLRLQVESLRAALGRGGADPGRLAAKADAALRQTGRLGALFEELLDVTRVGDAEIALAPAFADLSEIARAAVERVAPDAAREKTEIRLHAPEPVGARVDRGRVERAMGHLLSNALRYGAGQPVDVRVEPDGDHARVVVEDRGIGIHPQDAERIFDRFERAASWRHYGGLGLGLFITRRIVEAHGGTIHVETARGEGATFVIQLPVDGPPGIAAHEGRGRDAAADRSGQPHA